MTGSYETVRLMSYEFMKDICIENKKPGNYSECWNDIQVDSPNNSKCVCKGFIQPAWYVENNLGLNNTKKL